MQKRGFPHSLNGHLRHYSLNTKLNENVATKHASERSTLALKPRGDVTRSPKQGYQWPHEKNSCPPKNFKKKLNENVDADADADVTCKQSLTSEET